MHLLQAEMRVLAIPPQTRFRYWSDRVLPNNTPGMHLMRRRNCIATATPEQIYPAIHTCWTRLATTVLDVLDASSVYVCRHTTCPAAVTVVLGR
jgi:hypothetical protein